MTGSYKFLLNIMLSYGNGVRSGVKIWNGVNEIRKSGVKQKTTGIKASSFYYAHLLRCIVRICLHIF